MAADRARRREVAGGTVIIVAPDDDLHANAVALRIGQLWRGTVRVVRLDLATYPIASRLEWHLDSEESAISIAPSGLALAEGIGRNAARVVAGWSEAGGCVIDAEEILGIWWRRARAPLCHPDVIEPEYRSFCMRAASDTFRSFLGALPCVHNDPDAEIRADRKPYQLHLAREAGLDVPETLITADQAAVLAFERKLSARGAALIFKGVANPAALAMPTRRLSAGDRERLPSLRYAPGIFQEYVDGTDLRIAVLDRLVFCCEWRPAERGTYSDVRLAEGARMWPAPVPKNLAKPLLRLHRRLGLTFGIYDFKARGDELLFLEVNPSGQWLDMELEGLCPLAEAWARKLVARTVRRRDLRLPPLLPPQIEALAIDAVPPTRGWVDVLPATEPGTSSDPVQAETGSAAAG